MEKGAPMHNPSNEELRDMIQEVFSKGYLMSVATSDEGGLWVADVIYVYDDDLTLYWMSDPSVRHSQAILSQSEVAVSITASGAGEDNLGLQLIGTARKVDGSRRDLVIKHFKKRGKPEPAEDDDVLDGDRWYELKPTRIELIHEKHFGFEKQSYHLPSSQVAHV
jgi:uncharacterized protein YhbP (UPF0306 family)